MVVAEAAASQGLSLYKSGRHDEALAAFSRAIEAQPSATLYKNRAAVEAALERWDDAERDLSAALGEARGALRSRILLKRSFARARLERHGAAAEDAGSAAECAGSAAERSACLSQAARCRHACRLDAAELLASAGEARGMVHEAQTLRLFFASEVPARATAGGLFEVEVRVANEFGLWRARDWPSAAKSEACDLVVDARGGPEGCLEVVGGGRARVGADAKVRLVVRCSAPPGARVVLRVATVAGQWTRRPIAVLSLPMDVRAADDAEEEDGGAAAAPGLGVSATCCREVSVGPGTDGVVVAEAPGALGIGGKLWDASFALLAYVRSGAADGRLGGKRALELGSGVGAVGIGASRYAAAVTLSDVDAVVPLLEANVRLNGAGATVDAVAVDWFRDVPASLRAEPPDVILASDVVYDPDLHAPLLRTLHALLDDCGVPLCLLAHRHRNPHDDLFFSALDAEFAVVENFLPDDLRADVPPDVRLFSVRPRAEASAPPGGEKNTRA